VTENAPPAPGSSDWRPVPDPTELTTRAVALATAECRRDIEALREILAGKIGNVQDVSAERFKAIDGTFGANALALTAALAAQKEAAAEQNKSNALAIDKSERATKETIAANAAQAVAGLAAQAAIAADLKDRVVRLETAGPARLEERSERRLDHGVNMASVMAVIAVVSVVAAIALGLLAAFR
jgi:hypothetical protein